MEPELEVTRKRVLFLFAHLNKGGMQRAVSNISLALPEWIEQHIGFFGTENPGFPYQGPLHDFAAAGSSSAGLYRRITTLLARVSRLRRFVADERIDTVVSFGETANLYNVAAHHGARTVLSIRVDLDSQFKSDGRFSRLYGLAIDQLYPRADKVVAVSKDLGERVARRIPRLGDRLTVINNLYHLDTIRRMADEELPEPHRVLAGKRFILNVGSLQNQKGQDLLLQAFAMSERARALHLVIVGRGDWKERLLAQAQALGVDDRLTLIDFDPNPYRFMRRAHLFVLSSRFEGFPNVLVEAMISGAPVVAFDCPTGPREILADGAHGLLVKPLEAGALAVALDQALASDAATEALRRAASDRATAFGPEHVISRWLEVL